MAAFHEILFPAEISYGSSGGPKFKTTIFEADSGYEQRNIDWSNQKAEYDVSHGIKDQAQMDALTAFFYARRGRAYGFRFKDWNDYSIAAQQIAVGDGATLVFQIVKTYRSAQTESGETDTYIRKLTKIAWGSVAGVTVGGVVVTPDRRSRHRPDYDGQCTTPDLITFVNRARERRGHRDRHGAVSCAGPLRHRSPRRDARVLEHGVVAQHPAR
jgi:uncharacterized protein (TIGR02217 family)